MLAPTHSERCEVALLPIQAVNYGHSIAEFGQSKGRLHRSFGLEYTGGIGLAFEAFCLASLLRMQHTGG